MQRHKHTFISLIPDSHTKDIARDARWKRAPQSRCKAGPWTLGQGISGDGIDAARSVTRHEPAWRNHRDQLKSIVCVPLDTPRSATSKAQRPTPARSIAVPEGDHSAGSPVHTSKKDPILSASSRSAREQRHIPDATSLVYDETERSA